MQITLCPLDMGLSALKSAKTAAEYRWLQLPFALGLKPRRCSLAFQHFLI